MLYFLNTAFQENAVKFGLNYLAIHWIGAQVHICCFFSFQTWQIGWRHWPVTPHCALKEKWISVAYVTPRRTQSTLWTTSIRWAASKTLSLSISSTSFPLLSRFGVVANATLAASWICQSRQITGMKNTFMISSRTQPCRWHLPTRWHNAKYVVSEKWVPVIFWKWDLLHTPFFPYLNNMTAIMPMTLIVVFGIPLALFHWPKQKTTKNKGNWEFPCAPAQHYKTNKKWGWIILCLLQGEGDPPLPGDVQ